MYRQVPAPVLKIIDRLEKNGHRAYLVGGCVRDLLRGVVPQDWDVATTALPSLVQEIFPRTLPTGIAYGTVTVICGDDEVEVTTLRRDGIYRNGRHPSRVFFGEDIGQDLRRRDFTINAMAYDPRQDELIDPTGGLEDLQAGILRAVGDPRVRFREDALRMLRAIRFVGQLGLEIEPETWQALCSLHTGLGRLASERIRPELDKILLQGSVASSLAKLDESGLLGLIFPPLYSQNSYPLTVVFRAAGLLPPVLHLRLAGLLVGLTDVAPLLKGLHYGKDFSRQVGHLIKHLDTISKNPADPASLRYFLSSLGREKLTDLGLLVNSLKEAGGWSREEGTEIQKRLQKLGRLAKEDFPLSPAQLAVDGSDIIDYLELKPGPWVGVILEQLWLEVLEAPSRNRREYLLSRARQIKP